MDEHKYIYTIEVEDEWWQEEECYVPTTFTIRKDGKDFSMDEKEYEKFIEIVREFVWDYVNNGMHWLSKEEE